MAGENENIIPGNEIIEEGNVQNLDLGAQIDQTVNAQPSIQDIETIRQASAQFDPLSPQTLTPITAVGNQGVASTFPTLNQPINVGNVGGQIIGNQPIFAAPGLVLPFGVLMEQQRQLQVAQQQQDKLANVARTEAELGERARREAFKFERPKIPTLKDPGFQGSLNEAGNSVINSFVDQAKQLFGADWQIALKSDTRIGREFQQAIDGIDVVARNADFITEKFANVQEGIKTGEVFFSDGVKKAFRDYEQMIGAFEGGDVTALANARQVLANIDGHVELNNFLKDSGILSNVIAQVTGGTGSPKDMGDFLALRTTDRKSFDRNIAAMVKNVRKSLGIDFPFTDAEIQNALEGHFQNQSKSETILVKKPKERVRLKLRPEEIKFQQGDKDKFITTTFINNKGERTEIQNRFTVVSELLLPQSKKGVKIAGVISVSPKGLGTDIRDITEINPISLQIIKFDDKQDNVQFKKVATTEIKRQVPIKQSHEDKILGKPVKFEEITQTIEMDVDASEPELRLIFGDEVFDALSQQESEFRSQAQPSGLSRTSNQASKISEFGQDKFNSLSSESQKRFLEKFK